MVGGNGWHRIGADPQIAAWAAAARGPALMALAASKEALRCGGTWAVGLDLLPNAPDGSLGGVPLPWQHFGLARVPLHRAQISAVYPHYPLPSAEETPAAFAFRRDRDAAHLDGLLPVGPQRRRMIKEPHRWILGLPLTECGAQASPLVVWEGSHEILRRALLAALSAHSPEVWDAVDVSDVYARARREVFEICARRVVAAVPGEAVLLHRLLLHGVAPWGAGAKAAPEGRIIAYFRPVMAGVQDWIELP